MADRLEDIANRLAEVNKLSEAELSDTDIDVDGPNDHSEKAVSDLLQHAYLDLLWASGEIFRLRTERLQLAALASQGTGTDLTPTLLGEPDVMFWYDYIHSLDRNWRHNVRTALGIEG